MFEPLTLEEKASAPNPGKSAGKRPIIPVPSCAPPMTFRHPQYGDPTASFAYHLADGQLAGYACRFDFVGPDGTPDKQVLPVTYCALGGGRWGWRAKGIPAPRPLYRLPDLSDRPLAPVIVCEGEKAVGAAVQLFPDHVATTPMHGAKSPQLTDWTPLSGRRVVVWPDHDDAGHQFAQKVAALAAEAGAAGVSIVQVPDGWPEKWDLADPVPDGVDAAILPDLVASAAPWQPSRWQQDDQLSRQFHSFGRYDMSEQGLFFRPPGDKERRTWLSGAFEVLALTRDPNSSGWGLLLRWTDPDGQMHEWAMPREALGGGRDEIWRTLLRGGLSIAPSTDDRGLLAAYLTRVDSKGRACGLSRIGWHTIEDKVVFVLPNETFGDSNGERVLWQTEARNETFFNCRGSLDGWRREIASKCVGNSRLVFGVSAAFAPPLLNITNDESGGFHFKGASRAGKTTVLLTAGSVWGGGNGLLGFCRSWRSTANGLEGIAEAHNDALLCLDEMGQVDAREAGEIAYMLANGTGKGRAGRDGSPRRSAHWALLFLSTGELSLAEKMAEIGKAPRAGQEVRLVEIPADAGAGYGIFEDLHGAAAPGKFAEDLRAAANRQYGIAIRQFLEQLTARYGIDPGALHELIEASRTEFLRKHLPPGASGQVRSVCRRFALVAAAGSLATAFGLTGWPDDEADRAAGICFKAWIAKRGSAGEHEIEAGIRQVIAFIEAHGSSRFEDFNAAERVNNRVGYRETKEGRCHYYVLPEMWKREVTKGFDAALLANTMVERGLIIPGKDGKPAKQKKIKGENHRVYALAPGIIGSDEPEDQDAG
jgi:uncharacterized protein (DUF927 family)